MSDEARHRRTGPPKIAGRESGITRDGFGNRTGSRTAGPSRQRVAVEIPSSSEALPKPPVPVWFVALSALLAMLAVFGWGFALRQPSSALTGAGPEPAREDLVWTSVKVRADGRGQVLQVTGPDPEMVLRGYCEPWPSQVLCEAIEVTSTSPPLPGVRMGIFKDPQWVEPRAIRIERSHDAGRWVAGDGERGLEPMRAPDYPVGTPAIPVSRRQ